MKVAVINYSGSVGKTLVSTYLLAPRLKDAKFFAVETINQSASDLGIENVTSFKGDDFSRLIEDVVLKMQRLLILARQTWNRFNGNVPLRWRRK